MTNTAKLPTWRSALATAALASLASCAAPVAPSVQLPAVPNVPGQVDSLGFANREGQVEFATPSRNIGCVYTPAGGTSFYKPASGGPELICDRVSPSYVRVVMAPSGPPQRFPNPGDQGCCGAANTLAYGQTWIAGPFACTASTGGLQCTRNDGRSFTMSKMDIALK